jgi:hypothetical protein
MSEEQGKPAEKWYKQRSSILMLATAVICGIIALPLIGWAMNDSAPDMSRQAAYNTAREDIQTAVTNYSEMHNQALPTLNGTYTTTNCSGCHVINISALGWAYGMNLSASGNDNCGGNASLGCSNYSSYIWIVDTHGTVYSYCAGAKCTTNNSGYQGVWP